MSIIKALVYFGICHLIVCQRTDNCDVATGAAECGTTMNPSDSHVNASCYGSVISIHVWNANSSNPLSGHNNTQMPSIKRLWNRCKNNTRGLDDPIDTKLRLSLYVLHGNITSFPDNYFCHLPITSIHINRNVLNDTTKLGFSTMENYENRCLTKLDGLSLSYNRFEKVSNDSFCGLDGLEDLFMDNGQLKELERDAFVHLISLRRLSFSNNSISIVSAGVFRQQQITLTSLSMSNNKLNSSSILELKSLKVIGSLHLDHNLIKIIPNGLFEHMSQLQYLYLAYNFIKTLQGALTGLTNLRILQLENNNISEIHKDDFKDLVKVYSIEIQNNPIHTFDPEALTNCVEIRHITITNTSLSTVPNVIKYSENLRTLNISNNKFTNIKYGTFDKCWDVTEIDLSYNQLTDITNIFSKCKAFHLKLDHNKITAINLNDFSPKLRVLTITHNHIHTIGFDISAHKTSDLARVDVSHNHLSELHNISLPASLYTFKVSDNNISAMSYSDTYLTLVSNRQSYAPTSFLLQNNSFTVIDKRLFWAGGFYKRSYHLSGNPLVCSCDNVWLLTSRLVYDDYTLTCKTQFQRLGQKTVSLFDLYDDVVYESNNNCKCGDEDNGDVDPVYDCNVTCPTQCKCYRNVDMSIVHIDCSSNDINRLPLTPTVQFNFTRKLFVYLDNNTISQIRLNSLIGLNNTTELYLNWTGLSEIADGSFDHLIILNVLNLENNNLRHISENMLKNLSNLTQLFLSHNKIQTIESNAFPSQLQTLHLDNNQMLNFNVWQLDHLTNLMNLSVSGNKWSCESNFTKRLEEWLCKNSYIVIDIDKIVREQPNGTVHRVSPSSHCPQTTSRHLDGFNITNDINYANGVVYVNTWAWLLVLCVCIVMCK